MRTPIDLQGVVAAAGEELATAFDGRTRPLHEHVGEGASGSAMADAPTGACRRSAT